MHSHHMITKSEVFCARTLAAMDVEERVDDEEAVNRIAIGERVGSTAPVAVATRQPQQQQEHEALVKTESIAQAVPHTVVHPVIEAANVTLQGAATTPAGRTRRQRDDDDRTRRVQPRRQQAPAPFRRGNRVRAQFEHDGVQQWFSGTLLESIQGSWKVRFDYDGDEPVMPEYRLERLQEPDVEPQPSLPSVEPVPAEADAEEESAVAAVEPDAAEVSAAAAEPDAGGEDRLIDDGDDEHVLEDLPRYRPPAADDELKKVKDEQMESARKGERSREHTAQEKLRQQHLVELDGVTPCKLWRRMKTGGAPGGSIGCVLGGQLMHPFPTNNSDGKHIPKGFIFIAGNNGFNPYLPWYAGDDGFVEEFFVAEKPAAQKTVPLFRECTARNMFPLGAYHGKNAVNGKLYLGEYTISDVTFEMAFNEYNCYTQEYRTEWQVRIDKDYAEDKYYGDEAIPSYTTNFNGTVVDHHDGLGDDDENPGPETFEQYFARQKSSLINNHDKAALLRKRRMENKRDSYIRLQYERYDHTLYNALVAVGAQAVIKGKGKTVSLELDDLGAL